MNDKTYMIAALREEFNRWEELLAGVGEGQPATPPLPPNWSVKDVITHLWAWQQLSIARMEAALLDSEPEFAMWPPELDPESRQDVHRINDWIHD